MRSPLVAAAAKLWATLFYGHVHRPEDRDAVVKGDTLLARCYRASPWAYALLGSTMVALSARLREGTRATIGRSLGVALVVESAVSYLSDVKAFGDASSPWHATDRVLASAPDASLRAAFGPPARDRKRHDSSDTEERVGARRDAGPGLQGPLGSRVAESSIGRVPPVAHALARPCPCSRLCSSSRGRWTGRRRRHLWFPNTPSYRRVCLALCISVTRLRLGWTTLAGPYRRAPRVSSGAATRVGSGSALSAASSSKALDLWSCGVISARRLCPDDWTASIT